MVTIPASFPSATNTGVPAGTVLTTINGSYTITTGGTAAAPFVFQRKRVTGRLTVDAEHVLVRYCRVLGDSNYGIHCPRNNVKVKDCEIGPDGNAGVDNALSFERFSVARRCNIHNGEVNIKHRSDCSMLDNYCHSIHQIPGSHNGGIHAPQADRSVIRHNTILGLTVPNGGRCHNGISIYDELTGSSTGCVIEDNLMDHNGHHIFCAITAPFTIRRNVLTDDFQHAPFYNSKGGWTASGNVDQDGNPVTL